MSNPESAFQEDLRALLNRYSKESQSNTPDFILMQFLIQSLDAFNLAVNTRTAWFQPEGCEKTTTELSPVNATGFTVEELKNMHPTVQLPPAWEAKAKQQDFTT